MRNAMLGVAGLVCLALLTGCGQNAAETQKLAAENAELKAQVVALQGENAKLAAQLAEARKTPEEIKVPDYIKPIEVGGTGLASYHLKLSIVGNRIVAEDLKGRGVTWSCKLDGTEVHAFGKSSSGAHLEVTTDRFHYEIRFDNGQVKKKEAVE